MSWYGPHPKKGAMVPCVHCGKEIYSYPSSPRKFCGIECRSAAWRAQRVRDGQAHCARCGAWKPIEDFVKGVRGAPHSYCKPCSSQWFHERRGTPEEKRKPYAPMVKQSAEEKAAKKLAYQRKYRNKAREKVRWWNKLRLHRQRAAGVMPDKWEIGRMLCEQDARCAYCNALLDKYHIDHKTPVSRGGTNDIWNLQLLCPTCNMRKGTAFHEHFVQRFGRLF